MVKNTHPIIFILLLFISCQNNSSVPNTSSHQNQTDRSNKKFLYKKNPMGKVALPNGKILPIGLAITDEEQRQGFSGIKEDEVPQNEGLLFYYTHDEIRMFWMPDTYFNLDIYFLDEDLNVIDIDRNVQAHPGRHTPPPIPTTRRIICRHVLEIPSNNPISQEIKKGTQLKWLNSISLDDFIHKIQNP